MALPPGNGGTGTATRGTKRRDRDQKKINGGTGTTTSASRPKVGKNPKRGARKAVGSGSIYEIDALNPPFDPRMRRIGSPQMLPHKIKRGWIQTGPDEDEQARVNFLYNPSQLGLDHGGGVSVLPPAEQKEAQANLKKDPGQAFLATTGAGFSLQLLYDRTYELFTPPKSGEENFAHEYGVWADVAAWYTYLKILDEYPTSWEDSMPNGPLQYVLSHLFVGPKMVYYGYVESLRVTYSHWTQNMVPVRCAVDLTFAIQPDPGVTVYKGEAPIEWSLGVGKGGYTLNPDGTVEKIDLVPEGVSNTVKAEDKPWYVEVDDWLADSSDAGGDSLEGIVSGAWDWVSDDYL